MYLWNANVVFRCAEKVNRIPSNCRGFKKDNTDNYLISKYLTNF